MSNFFLVSRLRGSFKPIRASSGVGMVFFEFGMLSTVCWFDVSPRRARCCRFLSMYCMHSRKEVNSNEVGYHAESLIERGSIFDASPIPAPAQGAAGAPMRGFRPPRWWEGAGIIGYTSPFYQVFGLERGQEAETEITFDLVAPHLRGKPSPGWTPRCSARLGAEGAHVALSVGLPRRPFRTRCGNLFE